MANLTVKGLDKLQKHLKENITMNDVKKIVRKNGADMQQKMQDNADFSQGYQTGQTKRSIGLEIIDGGFTAESGPTTDYAPYVEYGTRFMLEQPFVKPALDSQSKKFLSDLQKCLR